MALKVHHLQLPAIDSLGAPIRIYCAACSGRWWTAERFGPLVRAYSAFIESDRRSEKRISEFLAGRYCARRVIKLMNPQCAEQGYIAATPEGAPVWPAPLVGSITHGAGLAAAAAAEKGRLTGIGIDIEEIVRPDLSARLLKRICSQDELDKIHRCNTRGWNREELATLVFSIKESAYKASNSLADRPIAFKELRLDLDSEIETFEVRLSGLGSIFGTYHIEPRRVITLGAVRR